MSEIKLYKIRRKSDGLFSTGGTYPRFEKRGKTWNTAGTISSHLAQFIGPYSCKNPYRGIECEILEIVLREECITTSSVADRIETLTKNRAIKEERAKARRAKIRQKFETT